MARSVDGSAVGAKDRLSDTTGSSPAPRSQGTGLGGHQLDGLVAAEL